jgi:hypothetical protein
MKSIFLSLYFSNNYTPKKNSINYGICNLGNSKVINNLRNYKFIIYDEIEDFSIILRHGIISRVVTLMIIFFKNVKYLMDFIIPYLYNKSFSKFKVHHISKLMFSMTNTK